MIGSIVSLFRFACVVGQLCFADRLCDGRRGLFRLLPIDGRSARFAQKLVGATERLGAEKAFGCRERRRMRRRNDEVAARRDQLAFLLRVSTPQHKHKSAGRVSRAHCANHVVGELRPSAVFGVAVRLAASHRQSGV